MSEYIPPVKALLVMTLFSENLPIILFWSHKSGCTSLTKWFFFQIGLLETALQHNAWIHSYREIFCSRDDYISRVSTEIAQNTKTHYKLVRNPYERAVSSFVAFIGASLFISSLEHLKPLLFNGGISFKQFLRAINEVGASIYTIDPHFCQQYVEGEKEVVNNYIYLNNIEEEIRSLEKKYNLPHSPLEEFFSSVHHNPRKKVKYPYSLANTLFTIESFNKIRSQFPSYDSFYDEETKQLVREIYKNDFQTYGYS